MQNEYSHLSNLELVAEIEKALEKMEKTLQDALSLLTARKGTDAAVSLLLNELININREKYTIQQIKQRYETSVETTPTLKRKI